MKRHSASTNHHPFPHPGWVNPKNRITQDTVKKKKIEGNERSVNSEGGESLSQGRKSGTRTKPRREYHSLEGGGVAKGNVAPEKGDLEFHQTEGVIRRHTRWDTTIQREEKGNTGSEQKRARKGGGPF